MNRRTLLKAAAAAGSAIALPPSCVQQPAPSSAAKQPRVWLELDQKALDDAYNQSVWAANAKQLLGRYAALSDDVRARTGTPQRFSCGDTPVEALDVYRAGDGAPIQIFIHGGAWSSGTAKEWAFPADMFVHRGAHFVVPDFVSVIDAGGNLFTMAEQVRSAVAWIYRNAERFVLRRIPRRKEYAEHELNTFIEVVFDDYCTVRREWIMGQYMTRENHVYRLAERGRAVVA